MDNNIEFHSFMCINCGKRAYTLPRPKGHKYKQGHLKKLYCPHCKQEFNCVECFDDKDVIKFRENFEKGEYNEEKENSISALRNPGVR